MPRTAAIVASAALAFAGCDDAKPSSAPNASAAATPTAAPTARAKKAKTAAPAAKPPPTKPVD